jgi:hypothetical protein
MTNFSPEKPSLILSIDFYQCSIGYQTSGLWADFKHQPKVQQEITQISVKFAKTKIQIKSQLLGYLPQFARGGFPLLY